MFQCRMRKCQPPQANDVAAAGVEGGLQVGLCIRPILGACKARAPDGVGQRVAMGPFGWESD